MEGNEAGGTGVCHIKKKSGSIHYNQAMQLFRVGYEDLSNWQNPYNLYLWVFMCSLHLIIACTEQ